jgi:hypothetical protein
MIFSHRKRGKFPIGLHPHTFSEKCFEKAQTYKTLVAREDSLMTIHFTDPDTPSLLFSFEPVPALSVV